MERSRRGVGEEKERRRREWVEEQRCLEVFGGSWLWEVRPE